MSSDVGLAAFCAHKKLKKIKIQENPIELDMNRIFLLSF